MLFYSFSAFYYTIIFGEKQRRPTLSTRFSILFFPLFPSFSFFFPVCFNFPLFLFSYSLLCGLFRKFKMNRILPREPAFLTFSKTESSPPRGIVLFLTFPKKQKGFLRAESIHSSLFQKNRRVSSARNRFIVHFTQKRRHSSARNSSIFLFQA